MQHKLLHSQIVSVSVYGAAAAAAAPAAVKPVFMT